MTLSNIFFGKKVVQQAYLNNALIYQSKGWETLPSTCMEEWTKDYDDATSYIYDCAIDLDNKIYVVTNNGKNNVIKLDSDGKIIWKKYYKDANHVKIDSNSNAFIVSYTDDSYHHITINKLDSNGNGESVNVGKVIQNYNLDRCKDFVVDDDFFYFSCFDYNDDKYINYYYLVITDKKGNLLNYKTVDSNVNCIESDNNRYLYYSDGHQLFRISKKDLTNNVQINSNVGNYNDSDYIKKITIDSLGNIICMTTYSGAIMVDRFGKQIAKYDFNSYVSPYMCTDYKGNIYGFSIKNNESNNKLTKYSSDSTLIFRTDTLNISGSGNSNSFNNLVTDYHGNIYYLYCFENELTIKKLINIEKKGN